MKKKNTKNLEKLNTYRFNKFQTMIPTYTCHFPMGSSTNGILHFGEEIKYGFFGPKMTTSKIPRDFPLYQITAPLSLHYSVDDVFTHQKDIDHFITQLNGTSDLRIQYINRRHFDHEDFVWGMSAADLVYSEIIEFFKKYQ